MKCNQGWLLVTVRKLNLEFTFSSCAKGATISHSYQLRFDFFVVQKFRVFRGEVAACTTIKDDAVILECSVSFMFEVGCADKG